VLIHSLEPTLKKSENIFNTLLTLGACTVLSGCGETQSPAGAMMGPHAVAVKLMHVTTAKVEETSEYQADLKSRKSISLFPQINGHVTKIFVTAGDLVKENQPMIEVDPYFQKASVDSYQEAVESDKADLETAKSTLRSLEAARIGKSSNLKYANIQKKRYELLQGEGAVAKQDLDQWTNQAEAAQADLDNTEAQIRAQEASIKKYERAIVQAKDTLKSQNVQLGYYTVKAPFAGMVSDIPVKLGDYVTPTTKLTNVTQNNPLEAYISIPTEHAQELHIGMVVRLLDAHDKELATGKIFFIAPNVDESSQSVLAKASIPNDHGILRADQMVRSKVIWKTGDGLLVPTEAVTHAAGQEFVYIAQGSEGEKMTAKQVPVTLGDIEGKNYQVKSGLKSNDQIVVSGVQNLMDGIPITMAK
jgi:RND family efflux transporter MFP subunit